MTAIILTALTNHYYFQTMSAGELEKMASFAHLVSFNEGETVFLEGEAAKSFFIIVEGQVQVYKMSPKGRQVIIRLFNLGESFAEIPFWGEEQTYPANALCLEKTTLLVIEGASFKKFVTDKPKILMTMLSSFSAHLRELSVRIEDLSLRSMDSKLAKYLSSYQENFQENVFPHVADQASGHVEIQIQKKTLASILGTIPETLSRSFKKFADKKIISIQGRSIKILNPEALQKMAELDD